VRYEDLVADPQTFLERVYKHCGLSVEPAMMRAAAHLVDPNRRDTWRRLDVDVIEKVFPEIKSEMAHYEYTVPEEVGNIS
jgi:hypothetical protein